MLDAPTAIDSTPRKRTNAVEGVSLVRGGLIYGLQKRLGLTPNDAKGCHRAALATITVTWVPLALLAFAAGDLVGHRLKIAFLFDFWTNTRFLVTLPLLVVAEALIDARTRLAVNRVIDAGLVTEEHLPAYQALLRQVARLRDSPIAGSALVVVAIAGPIWLSQAKLVTRDLSSWQYISVGKQFTPAGWWLALVSNPLYRLVLIRWLWLLVVWTEFLRRVVRLPLRYSPCHPDKAGGLGFLGHTQVFFGIITFALSAAVAGGFANLLTYEGSSIAALKFGIFGFWVAAVAVLVVPLLFLAPRLFEVKQRGLNYYGILASEYTRDFDRKWLRPAEPARESLLGTPDIQSLSDLNQSYSVVREMHVVMIDRHTLLALAIPPVIPMLLLLVSTLRVEAVLKAVLRLLA
jgi:hypothetical protein